MHTLFAAIKTPGVTRAVWGHHYFTKQIRPVLIANSVVFLLVDCDNTGKVPA